MIVDLPEGGGTLARALEGFVDVETARIALESLAADPRLRVFLVLRPDVDLRRPGRPAVEVEWIDDGRQQVGRVLA